MNKAGSDKARCIVFGADAASVECGISHAIGILSKKPPTPVDYAAESLLMTVYSAKDAGKTIPSTKQLASDIATSANRVIKAILKERLWSSKFKGSQIKALKILLIKARRLYKKGIVFCNG